MFAFGVRGDSRPNFAEGGATDGDRGHFALDREVEEHATQTRSHHFAASECDDAALRAADGVQHEQTRLSWRRGFAQVRQHTVIERPASFSRAWFESLTCRLVDDDQVFVLMKNRD